MWAVRFHEHGDSSVLKYEEVEEPEIGPNEVLVRVKAASVNRIDVLVRNGYPGIKIPLPHIPGADLAGVIEETGDGVSAFREGDRVIATPVYGCGHCEYCSMGQENLCKNWRMLGFHVDGSYAELVKVPARTLIRIPDGLGYREAAALPLALLTSWNALVEKANIKSGETVLVWAGGSGIGVYSIQIAKALGLKVVATAGAKWKMEKLKDMGVDLVLNHYEDDVVKEIKERFGGVDVVVEHIGAKTIARSIQALRPGGRIVLFGVITGDTAEIPLRLLYLKHARIIGLHTGSRWMLQKAMKFVKEGKIKPVIDSVYKLREAAEAHKRLEAYEHFGKIILEP